MDTSTIALVVCGLYLAVTLVAGIVPGLRVSKSVSGYVAADRSMSTVVLYFVLGASIFSSFAFLGGPGWAYSRGVAALYIIGYGVIGMLPLYFLGPRTRSMGIRHGFVTQAELFAHRFDSRLLSVVLALVSVAAFVPYLVVQMKGAGIIVETLTDGRVSAAVGAGVAYGVVLVYVLSSGVLGVGWTNTLQGVFMMVVAWFLGLYLPYKLYGGVGAMFDEIRANRPELLEMPGLAGSGEPWTWAAFASAVLVSAIGFTMWPHLFMKSYAAKSNRSLRLTVVLYPTFQLFLVPILLIGFAGVIAHPQVTPSDSILPYLLTQIDVSPILIGLVCAGTLAASMSSGDSILHSAASVAVRDGIKPMAGGLFAGEGGDRKERRAIRIAVVVLSLVAYYFAVVSEVSLVALLLAAYGGIAQIMPVALATFFWRGATRAGVLSGLIGGLVVNCVFLLRPEWGLVQGLHEGVYGLLVNLVLLVVVSAMTRGTAGTSKASQYIEEWETP